MIEGRGFATNLSSKNVSWNAANLKGLSAVSNNICGGAQVAGKQCSFEQKVSQHLWCHDVYAGIAIQCCTPL